MDMPIVQTFAKVWGVVWIAIGCVGLWRGMRALPWLIATDFSGALGAFCGTLIGAVPTLYCGYRVFRLGPRIRTHVAVLLVFSAIFVAMEVLNSNKIDRLGLTFVLVAVVVPALLFLGYFTAKPIGDHSRKGKDNGG